MAGQNRKRARDRRHERGVSTVLIAGILTTLIAAAALSIDVGAIWVARTQLQAAADASALAAAANMIETSPPAVTLTDAQVTAGQVANSNTSLSNNSLTLRNDDIDFGNWDLTTRTLDTAVDLTDPNVVTGVRVIARMDDLANTPAPAFMSRVLGRRKFDVNAEATAYLGFSGSAEATELVLPIMIDCCKLRGPQCTQDYCTNINNPPNACSLDNPQTGDGQVSCLEFASTPDQNACWTEFEQTVQNVNTSDMVDIVEDGNPFPVSAGEKYYSDNGTKTPVISEIYDRFHGIGYDGDGIDRYPPHDGTADSWVVKLPVVECQSEDHCAGGDPHEVVGFVCFEIREVVVTPEKIIRGRFLCGDDDLMDECPGGGSGGDDFGIRAQRPVLVD